MLAIYLTDQHRPSLSTLSSLQLPGPPSPFVTVQTGIWPLVTFIYDFNTMTCVEGNQFLLTVFNFGGAKSTPALSPPLL